MATSKAKRLIVLAQPQQQRHGINTKNNGRMRASAGPEAKPVAPVKAHVYRSIAELNSGFETVIRELQTLGGNSLFCLSGLTAMRELVCRMRAQANRDFSLAIHHCENMIARR